MQTRYNKGTETELIVENYGNTIRKTLPIGIDEIRMDNNDVPKQVNIRNVDIENTINKASKKVVNLLRINRMKLGDEIVIINRTLNIDVICTITLYNETVTLVVKHVNYNPSTTYMTFVN